jgi:hypothetical protein
MNGEGIMALPQDMGTGAGMGAASTGGIDDLTPFIQAQNALKEVGANKFSRELLSVGAELDPAEVSAFLDEIRAAGLTEEDREVIREILNRVKDDPQNYAAIRVELLQEGYPEDLLPPTFDPEFFVALEIAVEADVTMAEGEESPSIMPPDVQGFAEGGIASLKPLAKAMQEMGRGGDTLLAHINPQEAALLKRMGGSGTINPYTGLREYKIGKALGKIAKAVTKPIRETFKAVSSGLKKVGEAAKKFAKSTVGRVVLTVALGAFLGPAAAGFLGVSSVAGVAAISAGIGAFGSGMLAGDSFKDSLRSGVKAAALAGIGTAAYGGVTGTDVLSKGTYTGPKTLGDTYNFYKDKVNNLLGTTPTGTEAVATPGTAVEQLGAEGVSATTRPPEFMPARPDVPIDMEVGPGIETMPFREPVVQQPIAQVTNAPQPVIGTPTPQPAAPPAAEKSFFDKTIDFFSPSARSEAATQEVIKKAQTLYPNNPAAQELFLKANAPGALTKYGPLAAAGLGATYLMGGMEAKPAEAPGLIRQNYTGEDYLRENADKFGSVAMPEVYSYQSLVPTPGDFGRAPVSSPGTIVPTGITALPTARALVQEYNRSGMYGVPELYRARKGSSPEGVTNFPRKTGPINGPGTGTSDSIPAMLSDGEFVFTAKAVRNMGNGSRRKGAARMYKMMKMLEGGPVGMASKKG